MTAGEGLSERRHSGKSGCRYFQTCCTVMNAAFHVLVLNAGQRERILSTQAVSAIPITIMELSRTPKPSALRGTQTCRAGKGVPKHAFVAGRPVYASPAEQECTLYNSIFLGCTGYRISCLLCKSCRVRDVYHPQAFTHRQNAPKSSGYHRRFGHRRRSCIQGQLLSRLDDAPIRADGRNGLNSVPPESPEVLHFAPFFDLLLLCLEVNEQIKRLKDATDSDSCTWGIPWRNRTAYTLHHQPKPSIVLWRRRTQQSHQKPALRGAVPSFPCVRRVQRQCNCGIAPWGLPCGTRTVAWFDTYRFLLAEHDSSKLARGANSRCDAKQRIGRKIGALHVGELDTPLVGFCFTYSSILPNSPSSRLEHAAAECGHDAIETERTGGSRVQILRRGAVSPGPPCGVNYPKAVILPSLDWQGVQRVSGHDWRAVSR